MPWPTKKGHTWKPPCCATELQGKEDTVSKHGPTLPHIRTISSTQSGAAASSERKQPSCKPSLGFRVNGPARAEHRAVQPLLPAVPCCVHLWPVPMRRETSSCSLLKYYKHPVPKCIATPENPFML